MDVKVQEEKDLVNKKPVKLFGRDIRQITCFRDSFLYGITGGLVGGLVCFLATSKPLFSSHFAFGSTWVCVLAYWFPCRYKYESKALKLEHLKEEMKQKKLAELMRGSSENSSDKEN